MKKTELFFERNSQFKGNSIFTQIYIWGKQWKKFCWISHNVCASQTYKSIFIKCLSSHFYRFPFRVIFMNPLLQHVLYLRVLKGVKWVWCDYNMKQYSWKRELGPVRRRKVMLKERTGTEKVGKCRSEPFCWRTEYNGS